MFPIPALESLRTVEELATSISDMQTRLSEMQAAAGIQPLGDDDRAEWAALTDAIKSFKGAKEEAEERRRIVDSFAADPKKREEHRSLGTPVRSRIPEDLFDLTEYRSRTNGEPTAMAALMKDGAKKIIDQITLPHPQANRDKVVPHVHRLLDRAGEDTYLSNLLIATSSPTYMRAIAKKVAGSDDLLTPAERAAIATVPSSTTAGGYLVPVILDPAIMLTSDGSTNPLRQIARVETLAGAGNTWHGVTSAGITLTRGPAEGSAITSENTISFGEPALTVQPVKGEMKFSVESPEDVPGLLAGLAVAIQDAKDMEEADSFVNGVGTTVYPAGVVSTLAATSLVGTTGDGFDLTDIGVLIGRLPDRFEPNASFLGHRTVYQAIEDAQAALGGTSVSDLAAGQQARLRGYPRYNSSAMDDDVTTTGQQVLLLGDFRRGFMILDKVGLSIQDAGFVRDGSGQLTGQRALFIHYRNTSDILIDNAFRLLQIGVVTTGV